MTIPVLLIRPILLHSSLFFFFFNDTATTEIYTLSLHDALPISPRQAGQRTHGAPPAGPAGRRVTLFLVPQPEQPVMLQDRKSTRLNSSHLVISYAVFCLKKKKTNTTINRLRMHDYTRRRRTETT